MVPCCLNTAWPICADNDLKSRNYKKMINEAKFFLVRKTGKNTAADCIEAQCQAVA